ncbi:MAG: NAD(P)/FAD-dependent oxidoreductase [Bacilli bacterium]|nr:NAD(P)/FAD-dependent oxidoreductase [Bacilli bacterium]
MIRLRQIKVEVDKDNIELLKKKVISKLSIKDIDIISFKINKKSIDARKKDLIYYVYEVDLEVINEDKVLRNNKSNDIIKIENEEYNINVCGNKKLNNRIVIVGSGPAGLFCAYTLASLGYKPLIIERGEKIEDRVNTVEKLFNEGILNKNSNVQFGEGGAGTFSDGKLNTLVKDKFNRCKKVYEIFVENGAPEEILYLNKPHIGTDILRNVIINMRNKIISNGGEFRYNTTLTNLVIKEEKLEKIEVNNNELIDCEVLVLAIGHSARDTFKMLHENNLVMSPKPFAVGIRIMHPQEMINQNQYGNKYKLPPADYKLTYNTKEKRGVYSFCMCPGGYVVNASSEEKLLAINGMSNHARDSVTSNSAIVVTVNPNDYGNSILDGIKFQRDLETKAYNIGNGKIPVQLYKDYKNNRISTNFGEVEPIIKGMYTFANINEIFPDFINNSLKEAIDYYDTKIKGFSRSDAIVAGVESRTSSPIRIERDENFNSSVCGIYPIGEGAGYAGGITTSAIDGLKVSEVISNMWSNKI